MTRHAAAAAGHTLVLAAIALTLCILASLAHAQTNGLVNHPGDLSLIIPSCVESNQCYSAPRCEYGWVMVQVPTGDANRLANKCVAVGDLKDPQ